MAVWDILRDHTVSTDNAAVSNGNSTSNHGHAADNGMGPDRNGALFKGDTAPGHIIFG